MTESQKSVDVDTQKDRVKLESPMAAVVMRQGRHLAGFPVPERHAVCPAPHARRPDCLLCFGASRNVPVFGIICCPGSVSPINDDKFIPDRDPRQMPASRQGNGRRLVSRIRDYLSRNPGEFPSLEDMAGRLSMGSRTLRRWLVRESVTYQRLIDDTRRELAIRYLRFTSLTPKEIAFKLGYSSASNFRRAFKSWTGKKLSDFRGGDDEGRDWRETAN